MGQIRTRNVDNDAKTILDFIVSQPDRMVSRTVLHRKVSHWAGPRIDRALEALNKQGVILTAAVRKPGAIRSATFYSARPNPTTYQVKGVNVVRTDLQEDGGAPVPRGCRMAPSATNMPFLATFSRQLIELAKARTTDNWDPQEVHVDLSKPEPKIFLVDANGDYEEISQEHRVFAADEEFERYRKLKEKFEPVRQSR